MYVLDQRWYMFQNMGPAPSGRSGHAMASIGTRVFVLGGESFTPSKPEDANFIHVLDTSTHPLFIFHPSAHADGDAPRTYQVP